MYKAIKDGKVIAVNDTNYFPFMVYDEVIEDKDHAVDEYIMIDGEFIDKKDAPVQPAPAYHDSILWEQPIREPITLLPITDDTPIDTKQRATFSLDESMSMTWRIVGVNKWELKDSKGVRVDAIPTYVFTTNGQRTINVSFKTTGSTSKTITHGNVGMMLVRRDS